MVGLRSSGRNSKREGRQWWQHGREREREREREEEEEEEEEEGEIGYRVREAVRRERVAELKKKKKNLTKRVKPNLKTLAKIYPIAVIFKMSL